MSTITNISQVAGFDASLYANLVKDARSEFVSQAQIDGQLMTMLSQGKSFSEAVQTVQTKLPSLPPPLGEGVLFTGDGATLPSFGANYMALISDNASQERRRSAEQRAMQTEIIVDQIKDQADKMREKAIVQLCVGIVTGLASIAQGITASAMMGSGLKATAGLEGAAKTGADTLLNTNVQSFNAAATGVTGMMQSMNTAIGGIYDSEIKNIDATIERARSQSDALKSLEDSLKELLSKLLATQDAIQQNSNQTRTKILG